MARTQPIMEPRDASHEDQLETWFNYKIHVLSNRISRVVARGYSESYGIGVVDWRTLVAVKHFGPITASEIVQRTQIDKGSLSRAVDRLTNRGWVSQSTAPVDRRRAILELTAHGAAAYRDIAPEALARQEALLSVLGDDDRAQLGRLIDRLLQQADRMLVDHLD